MRRCLITLHWSQPASYATALQGTAVMALIRNDWEDTKTPPDQSKATIREVCLHGPVTVCGYTPDTKKKNMHQGVFLQFITTCEIIKMHIRLIFDKDTFCKQHQQQQPNQKRQKRATVLTACCCDRLNQAYQAQPEQQREKDRCVNLSFLMMQSNLDAQKNIDKSKHAWHHEQVTVWCL